MERGKNRRSVDASLASRDKELAQWAKAMAEAREGLDKIPAGWFNIAELAEKFGMAESGLVPQLRRLIKQGKAEKKRYFVARAKDGRRYKKTYYKLT